MSRFVGQQLCRLCVSSVNGVDARCSIDRSATHGTQQASTQVIDRITNRMVVGPQTAGRAARHRPERRAGPDSIQHSCVSRVAFARACFCAKTAVEMYVRLCRRGREIDRKGLGGIGLTVDRHCASNFDRFLAGSGWLLKFFGQKHARDRPIQIPHPLTLKPPNTVKAHAKGKRTDPKLCFACPFLLFWLCVAF